MTRALAALSLAGFLPLAARAQPAPARRVFERAEVHASVPGARETGGFLPVGRFECRGTTMLKLIATAYHVDTDAIAGGPDWLGSDRFDITAQAPPGQSSTEALQRMLQSLLADRFGLVVHDEPKEQPVYLLTLARKAAKLRKATNPGTPDCQIVAGAPGLNHRVCSSFSMADLSKLLPQVANNYIERPIVDTTGLPSRYDFPLDWMGKIAYLDAQANSDGPAAISIFDALGKLGLKLEPGSRPTTVIVVDHVNRSPSEAPRDTPDTAPVPTEFEVAEIRPGKPGTMASLTARNGRLEITGFTLKRLITMALDAQPDMVSGAPKWLDADRFDVLAKSPEVMSPHALAVMLKTLIVERFKLETHNERQLVPVFALVLGKRSPKLQKAIGSSHSECKSSRVEAGILYVCRNTTMAQLAERLPDIAGAYLTHPMINLTGLEGAYDFTLTWTPLARLSDAAAGRHAAGNDLTIFDAVDQQLGLKLEPQKSLMPVTVIDHVERTPVENP